MNVIKPADYALEFINALGFGASKIHISTHCIDGTSLGRSAAHAHVGATDPYSGYICMIPASWRDDRPSGTLLHEVAHFRAPPIWGGRRWTHHHKAWGRAFESLLTEWGYELTVPMRAYVGTDYGIRERR